MCVFVASLQVVSAATVAAAHTQRYCDPHRFDFKVYILESLRLGCVCVKTGIDFMLGEKQSVVKTRSLICR